MSAAGRILALIIVFSIYGGVNYYAAAKIYRWLGSIPAHINLKVYSGICVFAALSAISGFLPFNSVAMKAIKWIGAYWMGILLVLFVFFIAADLALFIGKAVKLIPAPQPRNIRFYAGLVVMLSAVVWVACGVNGRNIRHVSYDIHLKKNSPAAGMKIVLISDLHLGSAGSEKNLANAVMEINGMEPDIVCIAGDIFNDNIKAIKNPAVVMDLLGSINAKHGVYASLGNHDGGKTFPRMLDFLERSGIKLLKDEHAVIDGRLVLIGRLDWAPIGGYGGLKRKDMADILSAVNTDLPVAVMDHSPRKVEEYGKEADLILSGHTHGGQILLGRLITKAAYPVHYGYYKKDADSPHVIVTSGSSTWGPPLRVGSNNEIVSIVLR